MQLSKGLSDSLSSSFWPDFDPIIIELWLLVDDAVYQMSWLLSSFIADF